MKKVLAGVAGAAAFVLAIPPANASIAQDHLVSERKASCTPQVELGNFDIRDLRNVWDITLKGDTKYVSGLFDTVYDHGSTLTRHSVFSFTGCGDVTSFAPNVNGIVNRVIPQGQWLTMCGGFSSVNGVEAHNVAQVDRFTGAVNPNFHAKTSRPVLDCVKAGSRIILGGAFKFVGPGERTALASINATTGAFDPYINEHFKGVMPCTTSKCRPGELQTRVTDLALRPGGSELVALTNARHVGGDRHQQVVKITLGSNPHVQNWNPRILYRDCPRTGQTVRRQIYSPNGKFFTVVSSGGPGKGMCDKAVRFSSNARGVKAAAPLWINWVGPVDSSNSVADTGAGVYIQGHFTSVERRTGSISSNHRDQVDRVGIAVLHPRTGNVILSWKSNQPPCIGGLELQATKDGLYSGIDCELPGKPGGGIIFRRLP